MNTENTDYASGDSAKPEAGPFLAKVVSHLNPSYMGVLEVELLRAVGNSDSQGQTYPVKMMSPFWGSTSVDYTSDAANDYNNTQKSYGMWFVPPDVGNTVVVIFINGDPKRGYWIGCVPDENMNFSVPGLAATEQVVEGGGRLPVAEYNKKANPQVPSATKIKKPKHPLATVLQTQGLVLDDIRGITTSSSRRELPSSVFGISTPGPVDKANGAKQGKVGFKDDAVSTFVSRLGGTTFVMDDGDDKFLRKTAADKGPPDYVSVEQGETGGQKAIPHNELVRIRTRTGHQILFHNSEDLIYIANARGTAWIEFSSDGKIDVFANDSISFRTKTDFNFYADRDINFEAKRNINIKAATEMQLETGTNYNVFVGTNGKVTVGGTMDLSVTGNYKETAARIDMNGPAAAKAVRLKTHTLPEVAAPNGNLANLNSILRRVPTAEPYPQHENLDPTKYKPAQTNRDVDGRTTGTSASMSASPAKYKKYTTATDTFKQEKPASEKK